jgi:putative spermidine/putrescine transport system permease protein
MSGLSSGNGWRYARQGASAVVFGIVLLPMLAVIWLSFFRDAVISFPPAGYSLRWYVNAWETHQFGRSFVVSLEVALASTAIGVVIGTAAAYGLMRGRPAAAGAIHTLLLGPLAIPGVVLGTGLFILFVQIDNTIDFRVVGTLPGLIAAHTLLTVPWAVRLVSASLHGVDRAVEEAAQNLGARPLTVFRRITLPMMRSGMIAASLFGFVQSFENLDLTLLLTGPGRSTLPVEMLNYLEFRVDPTLAAVAAVQIAIIGLLMLVTDRFVNLGRVVS